MSTPSLVIIIPTKNRRALLERALASVEMQDGNPRMVVINDGSTDDTQTYLDSITSERLTVIHHKMSRGVNAARNAGFQTLREGEWAVQLDDDDYLLPDACTTIYDAIAQAPQTIQVLCFNARTKTTQGEGVTGRRFPEGETYFDPSYYQMMTGEGLDAEGDMRMVVKWTLFPQYLFSEDINGFEGEWWLLIARDAVGIRYCARTTTVIDQTHEGEQLRLVAARRDPGAFLRAHLRMLRAHRTFFLTYPRQQMARAVVALKLAVRAHDIRALWLLSGYYGGAFWRLVTGAHNKKERNANSDSVSEHTGEEHAENALVEKKGKLQEHQHKRI